MVQIFIMKIILVKKSYNERIQWVKDNYDLIINLDPEFILRADKNLSLLPSV